MIRLPKQIENSLYVITCILSLAIITYLFYFKFISKHNYATTIITNSIFVNNDVKNIYFNESREPITVHYDSLQTGKIYRFEFIINNPDYKPVLINNITTTCSCSGYTINKKILDSNDTTHMKVFFNARNKSGDQTIGLWFNIQGDTIPQKLYLTGHIFQ